MNYGRNLLLRAVKADSRGMRGGRDVSDGMRANNPGSFDERAKTNSFLNQNKNVKVSEY